MIRTALGIVDERLRRSELGPVLERGIERLRLGSRGLGVELFLIEVEAPPVEGSLGKTVPVAPTLPLPNH